jgi:CRISPR-associated protein Csm1
MMNNKPQLKEYLDMSEFTRPVTDVQEQGQNMLLLGGDFSGIQKYIYKIASKQAGRSLKGRSFYLHLLSDSIVRFLMKKLGLKEDSVVYNSGGSFYLTLPDTEQNRQIIEEAALEIETRLFDAHGTDLYLALAYVPMSVDGKPKNLRNAWTELFDKRNQQKTHKFWRLLSQDPDRFFVPFMKGGDFVRDSVTGEELDEPATQSKEGLVLGKITSDQIEIGKALQTCDCMLVTDSPVPAWNDLPYITPANLGSTYFFVQSKDLPQWKKKVPDVEVEQRSLKGSVKWVRTFEELSEGTRMDRLGVLRMDVDNLGVLFQQGIPAECATLGRYKQLSHKFDYFFSDYLHNIQKDVAKESSLVIYSGGDDLFIVGAWDHTIALAKQIREDFRTYTKGDARFSISGGIAIVENKFPIMKGAELSAREEHKAKTHTVNSKGEPLCKNSLSFMGTPLNWDTEFPAVEQLKNDLLGFLNLGYINKSFLGKVMRHAASARIENHKITNVKVYWMITYDLSRMRKETGNSNARKMIDLCVKDVCNGGQTLNGTPIQTDYHPLELWSFACRWAELEYRTRN